MKKRLKRGVFVPAAAIFVAAGATVAQNADDGSDFQFAPGSLVLTTSNYVGSASTVKPGEVLPLGCAGGADGSTNVAVPTFALDVSIIVNVPCGFASDRGKAPHASDPHNVWNNSNTDGSFGVSSPIVLDNLTTDGVLLGALPVPTDKIVTSFSSKSELAINLSVDGKSLTFMGYHGGPGCGGYPVSPTAPNLIDVSASNTPAVCDPTNPVITSFEGGYPTAYYRAVAEVDAGGKISITDGNAYSGDNGRAVMKGGNGFYYMAGNDNSGNLPKSALCYAPTPQTASSCTLIGTQLVNSTGVELLVPGAVPPVPSNIAMIGRLQFGKDKPGKDTNFRGLTIFNNTLYVSKGSGGNGVNTVYQVGSAGTLPTGTAAQLATVAISILPGFPQSGTSTFPFGLFFANATTLYVCDEGDETLVTPAVNGNVADASTLATAGVQKWSLVNGSWTMLYVLQNGLNIGVPYSVPTYPASLNPAADGCRNMTGKVNQDGTVDIYAITSTVSANGDQGADPNKLVKVTDLLSATTLPAGPNLGIFTTLRSAQAGEVFRGVAVAPTE